MKKTLVVIAIGLLGFASNATESMAGAAAQQNTGCGLGSTLITTNTTLVGQLAITFINGLSGNQTFGISSGTSGCDQARQFVYNEQLHQFVADNMDGLAKGVAMGEGEHLATLAELMDVSPGERSAFYTTLQANFSSIFTSESVQVGEIIDNIYSVIRG
jgi:hypothetical protein